LPAARDSFAKKFAYMRIKLLFLLLILGSWLSAINHGKAENGEKNSINAPEQCSLRGSVIDNETGEKLVCAKIDIVETGESVFTDILGNFTISGINRGTYTFNISYISYQEQQLVTQFTDPGQEMVISLKPR